MKWEKTTSIRQRAKGLNGTFYLEKSNGYWYGSYRSKEVAFNLPRNAFIKDLKKMCEENYYWEEDNDEEKSQRVDYKG